MLERSRSAPHTPVEDGRFASQHVSCAEADLDVLAGHLSTLACVLHDLEHAARDARRRWALADHVAELQLAFEEIDDSAAGWSAHLAALEARIQRVRELDEHYHLVGGRLMRLVPVEQTYGDGAEPNDDIPF